MLLQLQQIPTPTPSRPLPPFLHTVAVFRDNDFTDIVDLPAGVTSNQFSRYVATHRNVQTTADITDQQVAADAEVSGNANGSEMDHTGGRQ